MRFNIAGTILLSSVFLVLSSLGCTKKATLDYGLKVEETLRINLSQEPPSLDWHKSTDTTSALIEYNMMDGLTEFDLKDPELSVIPALAESWSPSNNSKKWTFTLRKDVKWTDGKAFEAQQIIDAWERLLNPETASQYAYFLFSVKNAEEYNTGKIKDFSKVGVSKNEQGQLVVELKAPMSYFPSLLTHHATYPIRLDVIKEHGDRWTDPENIQTLGAFKLKIWDHDKALVLERNDGYYGAKARVKNVYGYMINEYSTALGLFESGRLDYQNTIPGNELATLRTQPTFRESPILGMYYYGFNTRKKPFNDVRVRKAFLYAIDRRQITDLLGGDMSPLSGWVPKGMFGYQENVGIQYDPEKAKKLLKEAGYEDPSKFPRIVLGFNSNENHQRIAENYQAQIKKNLGVQIELQSEEWKVYLNRVRTDTPDIYRMGWLADYPDPDNFLNLMTKVSENNHTGWSNPKFDQLIDQGSSITDKEERRGIYLKAQKILTEEDVPVHPIYSMVSHSLVSERVKDFPINSMDKVVLKGVSLK
ncbi:MAG: oligopeptide-binding protein oppA [Thioclava sp.]|nr:oligopeptide-binding protein oppA [Thioclava sp.]|tara:strand:- start:8602 stop:10200 length:1599 start_codon:yes stop_codon:yes gene_type:complete